VHERFHGVYTTQQRCAAVPAVCVRRERLGHLMTQCCRLSKSLSLSLPHRCRPTP
jgi:hypothetical protein